MHLYFNMMLTVLLLTAQVLLPVDAARRQDRPKIKEKPRDMVVGEGDTVTLQCVATGKPSPTLFWKKETESSPIFRNQGQGRFSVGEGGSLTIHNIQIDDGGVYECQAKNMLGVAKATARILVASPPTFEFRPTDQVVYVGENVYLRCVVSGRPTPAVFWEKKTGSDLMLANQGQGRHSVGADGTLTIHNVELDDAGEYVCEAMNPMSKISASAMVQVKIRGKDPPHINIGPQNQTLLTRVDEALLLCDATGDPRPVIKWFKNGKRLRGDERMTILNSGTLQITDVEPSDSGFYTCKAVNKEGKSEASAYLTIVDDGKHYKRCPSSWREHEGRCYLEKGPNTFSEAMQVCNSQLPVILNEDDNSYIKEEFATPRGSPGVWLGLAWDQKKYKNYWVSPPLQNATLDETGYSKWSQKPTSDVRRSKACTVQTWHGSWLPKSCDTRLKTVCEKITGCDKGWYGAKCDKKCNCFKDSCENQFMKECPNGCEAGWKGELCDIPESEPLVSASYYCFKGQNEYSVLIYINETKLDISAVTVRDNDGNISPECDKRSFQEDRRSKELHINIKTDGETHFDPPCPARKLGDGPTLEWTFHLQKFTDIVTVYDEKVHVVCNFSAADTLTAENANIDIKGNNAVAPVSAPRTRLLDSDIYLATPKNLARLSPTDISPGQSLVLVVPLPADMNSKLVTLCPILCQASTGDGRLVKNLTDSNGCGVSDNGFNVFSWTDTENGPMYVSGRFLAFSFPGYKTVEFNCDFKPCRKSGSGSCTKFAKE